MFKNKENLSVLFAIFRMTQDDLLDYTKEELLAAGYGQVLATADYVYAEGSLKILLVAHLDTVHEKQPETIDYDQESGQLSSPQGLGADDRAGVFAILHIIKTGLKPYVLFTANEEDGCLGAKRFLADIECPEINYIIEFDRRGSDEAVFYGYINEGFIDYVLNSGFILANGSASDIRHLCPAWDMAGVNLSIGFYNAHQTNEFLRLEHMYGTIDKTIKLLERPLEQRVHYYKY